MTRDSILSACDVNPTPVEAPEWGGTVYVRVMSGTDRFSLADSQDPWLAAVLVRSICDATGARLFADTDCAAILSRSWDVLDRVYDVACKLSRIGKAGAEKNAGAPTGDSDTDSPLPLDAPSGN
jgi:hypothetical protein